ncbi:hypothetical protein [Aliivibrio fischeri]|nr:hypothetical protein [Aliivibrio fischeri]
MAQFNAKLVPTTSHDNQEQQRLPIGSGPYKVAENTDKKLS